jgi:hypothetical protein
LFDYAPPGPKRELIRRYVEGKVGTARRFAPEDFLTSRAAGLHRPASPGRWKVRAGAQLRRSRVLAQLFWRGIAVRLLPRRDIHDGFGVIGRPSWTGNVQRALSAIILLVEP